MADNLKYSEPSSGQSVATEEIAISGGIFQHFQVVKLAIGPRDSFKSDLDYGQSVAASSIPVVIASNQSSLSVLQGGPFAVALSGSNSFTLSNPQTTVSLTGVGQINVLGGVLGLSGLVSVNPHGVSQVGDWVVGLSGTQSFTLLNPAVSITGQPVRISQEGPFAVSLSGVNSVNIGNFPSTFGITQAGPLSTAISGAIPDHNVTVLNPTTAVALTGVSNVAVSNFPSVFGVSGTPTVQQGTSPWIVNGTTNAAQSSNWVVALSGSNNNVNATIQNPITAVAITGTVGTLNTNVVNSPYVSLPSGSIIGISGAVTVNTHDVTQSGLWNVGLVNGSVLGVSGSVNINGNVGQQGNWVTSLSGLLPAFAATPSVNIANTPTVNANCTQISNPWLVSGTIAITGQPLTVNSHAVTFAAPQDVNVVNQPVWTIPSGAVIGVSGQVTVNGTVTANQGAAPWSVSVTNPITAVSLTGLFPQGTVLGVSGSVNINGGVNATQAGTWNVNASQTTSPWVIGQGNNPLSVAVSSVVTTSVSQSTDPWRVAAAITGVLPSLSAGSANIGSVNAIQSGGWTTSVTGSLPTGTNSIGQVTANQGGTWNVNAVQSGGFTTSITGLFPQGTLVGISGSANINGTVAANCTQTTSPWIVAQGSSGFVTAISGSLPAGNNNVGDIDAAQLGVWNVSVSGSTVPSWTSRTKGSINTSGVQLIVASLPAKFGVQIKAANGNTGIVYVGQASGVTAATSEANDGFELGAGESMLFPVDDANKLWVIGSTTSQKLFYTVF